MLLKPVDAAIDDLRHAGRGLDVVHDGRLAEHPFDRREGRLDPRPGSLPFEALDQAGFFAADVSGRADVDEDVEREGRAEDVLTEQPGGVAFVDRELQATARKRILDADIEVSRRRLRGVAAQNNPFDHLMRIELHQVTIVKRPRFALVGIDAHVDRAGMVLRQERPFEPGGEARTASTA